MSVDYESLSLGGVQLNDEQPFGLVSFDNPPAPKEQLWAGGPGGDGERLVGNPRYTRRTITMRLQVGQQSTMDKAMAQVRRLAAKIEQAKLTPTGLPLVWTPANGTLPVTAWVLDGEVTALPIGGADGGEGYLHRWPMVDVRLDCDPFLYGDELTLASFTAADLLAETTYPLAHHDLVGQLQAVGASNDDADLLALWVPDPAAGAVVDLVGGYTATLLGDATLGSDVLAPGVVGSLVCDGTGDGADTDMPGATVFDSAEVLTVVALVAPDVADARATILADADNDCALFLENTGNANAKIGADFIGFGDHNVGTGPTLVAFEIDPVNDAAQMYVGGTSLGAATGAGLTEAWSSSSDLQLGEFGSYDLDGKLGPVAIYHGTLTPTEHAQLAAAVGGAIVGEAPGLGRLLVEEDDSVDRRDVLWGMEVVQGDGEQLVYDADSDLDTTGLAGAADTQGGSHTTSPIGADMSGEWLPHSAALALPHVGSYRVLVRAHYSGGSEQRGYLRATWRQGTGAYTGNPAVEVPDLGIDLWAEVDLGVVVMDPVASLAQATDLLLEASGGDGTVMFVDYVMLVPVSEGYGRARAPASTQQSVRTWHASDDMDDHADATALDTLTADKGGAWSTSGSTGDFTTNTPSQAVVRVTDSDSGPRLAVLGSDVEYSTVSARVWLSGWLSGAVCTLGVVARYVDADNYLVARIGRGAFTNNRVLTVWKRVAATDTLLWQSGAVPEAGQLTLTADEAGTWTVDYEGTGGVGSDADLVTGGALESGAVGLRDYNADAFARGRAVFDFKAYTLVDAEHLVLAADEAMEFRSDTVERVSADGTTMADVPHYSGGRVLVPVPPEGYQLRVAVRARRNDSGEVADTGLADSLVGRLHFTPRYTVVPGPA